MTTNGSALTFKWLVGILIAMVFAAGSALIADTKTNIRDVKAEMVSKALANQQKIECLEREKLDKEVYYRDVREIKMSLEKINDKLDKMRK